MFAENNRKIKKQTKKFLKELKPYEEIDNELKNYVEVIIKDPFVCSLIFLDDKEIDNPVGFAGLDENNRIRYIWIFRKCRGQKFGAKFCLKYGVKQPTKQLMHSIIEVCDIDSKNNFIQSEEEIWHPKTGFVITPLPIQGFCLSLEEYEYNKGTFKTIETMVPEHISDVDFDKLEGFLEEMLKYRGKGLNEIELPDIRK